MSNQIPASYGKRVGAFSINFLIAGLIGVILTEVIKFPPKIEQHFIHFLGFAYVLVFTAFPESPGKRALGLVTLDSDRKPISEKKRWIRNSIYLTYFGIMSLFYFLPPLDPKEMGPSMFLLLPTHLLIPLLLLANGLSVFMNPLGLSLIDMRTKSQTYGYEKVKGMLKSY